jgi:hypothetical protein
MEARRLQWAFYVTLSGRKKMVESFGAEIAINVTVGIADVELKRGDYMRAYCESFGRSIRRERRWSHRLLRACFSTQHNRTIVETYIEVTQITIDVRNYYCCHSTPILPPLPKTQTLKFLFENLKFESPCFWI